MQPATPPMYEDGMRTRSGRALGSPLALDHPELSRKSRSPRTKRAPRAKSGKARGPVIDEPLSILTKDYTLPIKNMEEWVNRSVDTRMKEVERKNGYIARPMNSFMLYRSAYADRVKQFCKENNHQVVSQVSGASWPLEPKEVRDLYERYASLERDNHHHAHPDYKFAPNKNGSASKKRKGYDDDESDLDDPDWEGSGRGSASARRSRTGRREESRSHSSTPFDTGRIIQHPLARYHPSSYQASNPHGPPPLMLGQNGGQGHYYQTTITPYGHQMEDLSLRRMDNPFPRYTGSAPLVGLPTGSPEDLLRPQSRLPTPAPLQGDPLDPRLLHYDPCEQYSQYDMVDQGYSYPPHYEYGPPQPASAVPNYGYPTDVNYHPGMATLTDGRDVWGPPDQPGADFDEAFGRWA